MPKLTDKWENPVSLPTQNSKFIKDGITSLIFFFAVKVKIISFPISF